MSRIDDLISQSCPDGVKFTEIGKVCKIKTGAAVSKQLIIANPGQYPVLNSGREPLGFIDHWNTENDPIGITSRGAGVGSITWCEGRYYRGNLNYSCTVVDKTVLSVRFLFYLLNDMQDKIQSICTYDGIPALNKGNLEKLEIPVPPLEIQQEIVAILDAFTKLEAELEAELEARQQQYRHYLNQIFSFQGSLEAVRVWKLGEVVNTITTGKLNANAMIENGIYPFYTCDENPYRIDTYAFDTEAIIVSGNGSQVGHINYYKGKFNAYQRTYVLADCCQDISMQYLLFYLSTFLREYIIQHSKKGSVPYITMPMLQNFEVPVPPLEVQKRIVAVLDKFDALVNDISRGLPAEIAARRQQYKYYRKQLLTFQEAA